jgi:16S rRNA (cytosine1402-N4)-methyltransferase
VLPNALPSPSPDAHVPVLAREVGALLDVHPGELVVDCTFGAGGHSRLLARALDGSGELVAIDRDPSTQPYVDALRATVGTGVQIRPMHGPFATCLRRLLDEDLHAAAILMDLGMSSMQVDEPGRGFSYTQDAALDMRMDPSDPETAATLVNEWGERDLAQIFSRYGEERFSRQIARAIVQERERAPFETTLQLVATIKRAIPTPSRFGHGHPAKRVFQALRIAVNDELGQLEDGLESALELCQPGGRVAVIAFHSLEDRIVKQRFVKAAKGCICPPDLPVCGCGRTPEFRLVTSRAVRPHTEEIAVNPRAASARLRVVQREVTP